MLKASQIIVSLLVPAALSASVPVIARDIVVSAHPTFRDFEFDYSGQNRINIAKASFGARIPVGTPTATARETMRMAGAHCDAAADNGQTKCSFGSFEAIEDHLHDVVWTIGLDSQNGQVARIDVTRESLGS